ncbi:MAG: tetratricopeptide repeat protein [Oscillatoriophycideae cyanobacterium NC_groundwater_1537_Pr4_S-0.65um_50_18]|nr:tetratricopeptide repeat protein [Oscillatoriophycideae cyanobacterium NC_groundwater_1537_Pr4_S-0.65um_50_18]
MQFSRLSVVVAAALTLNWVGLDLPVAPNTRSLLASATAQTASDPWTEARRLLAQGEQQRKTSYYQEAFSSFQSALRIYRGDLTRAFNPQESSFGEASALNSIGTLYWHVNQNQQALEYFQQALPIFQSVGSRIGEAGVLMNLGVSYAELNQDQKAIEHLQQALPIFRAVSDREGEAKTLMNLGASFNRLDQSQQAIDYFQQALTIQQEIRNRQDEALTLTNLAVIYGSLREYQQAIDYYRQALPIFRELDNRDMEGNLLASIGRLYVDYDSPQSAIQFLQQSLEVRESIRAANQQLPPQMQKSYVDSFADDYRLLANLLTQQNREAEAQQILERLK